jgi:hypothetical protein
MFSGCQLASDSDELDLETLCMLNRLGANSTLSDRAARLYELEVNPTGIALGWDGPVTTLRGEEMVVSHMGSWGSVARKTLTASPKRSS